MQQMSYMLLPEPDSLFWRSGVEDLGLDYSKNFLTSTAQHKPIFLQETHHLLKWLTAFQSMSLREKTAK